MRVLVLNTGSSSVKYDLWEMSGEQLLATGKVERIGSDDACHTHRVLEPAATAVDATTSPADLCEVTPILDHTTAIRRVLATLSHPDHGAAGDDGPDDAIAAVGHRVAHGGEHFTASVIVTPEVQRTLRSISDLAPLHNPYHLAGIEAAEAHLPGIPQVAVFDTAFHASIPPVGYLYALPYSLYVRYRLRRYGFHGTSHRWVSERLCARWQRPVAGSRVISCHLGNGCSLCAIRDGRSIDTSMGLTPLEGLVMGTRSGDVDPGAIPFVMAREDLNLTELSSLLNKHSGLRGLSGLSSDMREIEAARAEGHEGAERAFAAFVYRLRKYIGAYAAAMGGLDALIFTGGIGENSWRVREAACQNLEFLGVRLDEAANRDGKGERSIAAVDAPVAVWVIPTEEELIIARDTVDLLRQTGNAG